MLATSGVTRRRAIRVRGLVQGVGFRPYVYRLAVRHGLGGFVRNDTGGVTIEVEGTEPALREFLSALQRETPSSARIAAVSSEPRPAQGEREFVIRPSLAQAGPSPAVAPDVATCTECLRDVSDPANRRGGYAFTACAGCGPRFTVVEEAPYDRERTTLVSFPLCGDCRAEYRRPDDRRYHAEAIACPSCGPRARLAGADGVEIGSPDPVTEAARRIRCGAVAAVKGLGGFHLACDAGNDSAVRELRRRKGRDEKPFAVLVGGLEAARRICEVSPAEAELLESPARPIVLLRRLRNDAIAPSVAPGNPRLGLMVAYTPLHALLLDAMGGSPLVLTSGNVSDEPIAFEDEEAFRTLGPIADFFLTHDRRIRTRCDDSVARVAAGGPLLFRRSRGYAPAALDLPFRAPTPVLALGGAMKSVFALGRDSEAVLSHHLGDLDGYAAWSAYLSSIERYESLFNVVPQVLAHDLHPDYPSTRYAIERAARQGLRRVAVQHHHAHLASCMAENRLDGPVIGVTFDGTGYGTDGTLWGGEFLIGDYRGFRRAAQLRTVPMPGGERAIREPWRMALAYLSLAGEGPGLLENRVSSRDLEIVRRQMDLTLNAPSTSSCGRLFDGVASLVGLRDHVSHEGQAAVELEGCAEQSDALGAYPVGFSREDGRWIVDPLPMIAAIASEARRGVSVPDIARRFHTTLAETILRTCVTLRDETGLNRVALSGGVFMNGILLEGAVDALTQEGFQVYRHRLVPPNDGGLCLGQLAVAAAGGGC